MRINYFWNDWPKGQKLTFLSFLTLFIITLVWSLVAQALGIHAYLDWNILAEGDKAEVVIDTFQIGPFSLTQIVENTVFYQKFAGTAPGISPLSYYLFSGLISLMMVVAITVISTLKRFWFYIGLTLFTLLLVLLKTELLLLFGSNDKIGLIMGLILFLPLSYYFNEIRPHTTWATRGLVYGLVTIGYVTFLTTSATIDYPLFYLATSFTTLATVLSIVFILTVGHEIVAFFAYLLFGTGSSTTKNGIFHFLVISTVYLANVAIAYLHEINVLDWDVIYINVYVLLAISAILGIWGFRHREPQYDFLVKFSLGGGILYLALGIICFATINHFFTIGNDAGLEVIRDFILYAHMGYGLIFIFYILANFSGLLKSGLAIYKVIYKPTVMPYFTFRFAGLIVAIAFLLKANWQVPVYQNTASNFNSIADYHYYNGERELAERYYREASEYALYNHKSNYAIALINEREGNQERAIVRYKDAVKKWPSAQAYVNLAQIYTKQNRFFDALFTLKEGNVTNPENAAILNALGLTYGNTNYIDSAVYYLDLAHKQDEQGSATSNLMALLAVRDYPISLDSLSQEYDIYSDPVSINNSLVLSNKLQDFRAYQFELQDSALSPIDAAILNNTSINALFNASDSLDTQLLEALADHPANISFDEAIGYIACLHQYKNGRVKEAFRNLNWMANTSEKISAKYFDDIGLWALEQGAPDVAVDYFTWAFEREYADAQLHLAIALTENNQIDAAEAAWQQLLRSPNEAWQQMAAKMLEILASDPKSDWGASDRYLYAKYRLTSSDTTEFKEYLTSINEPNYRAQATLDMVNKLWNRNLKEKAIEIYGQLADQPIADDRLFEEIQFFELKMLADQASVRGLAQKINQGIEFPVQRSIEKAYYTALISEASNDSLNAANNYQYVADKNPFFEEAIIGAARYFNQYEPFKAYGILLEALEINPNSIQLLIAYIHQCGRVEQNTSGEIALTKLKTLVSAREFKEVETEYQNLLKEAAKAW